MLIFIDQGSVEPAGGPAAYAGEVGAGQRPTRDSQFAYYGVLRLVAWHSSTVVPGSSTL